ncbi:hypothetical protein H6778_03490 [Candidatus Nomurabacteria bacterium]|nr:hypothetical protein [Candidatus Nomurabacteria bacterium]
MSHNTLLEKIQTDVAAEIDAIKAAGAAEVAKIEAETEQAIQTLRVTHTVALEKELAQQELVVISKAKQAGKIALQSAKRAEIDDLFVTIEKELAGQAAEGYVHLFSKYASSIIPAGVVVTKVVAPESRVSETAEILKAAGVVAEVTPDARIGAGFILYTADGVYDVTLARIMSEARVEIEMEVVQTVMA